MGGSESGERERGSQLYLNPTSEANKEEWDRD